MSHSLGVLPEVTALLATIREAPLEVPRGAPFRIDDLPSVWGLDARTDWLIPPLIPEAAVTMLSGDSGVGKSTLLLALAGAVAHGHDFLGRAVRKRTVLYVDRENPLGAVKERLAMLLVPESADLKVWGLWNDPAPGGPESPAILTFARQHKPLIVFDSLIAFHTGSEQDASETRAHMQWYRQLAAYGATVVISHHVGKSEGSKQYRGSSDLKAAVDVAFLLESVGDSTSGISALRLTGFKNRLALPQSLRIDFADGRFRLSRDRVETNREIVERLVRDNPDQTQREVVEMAAESGVAKNRCLDLLSDGERNGWLKAHRGPRNRKTYRLSDPPCP